MRIPILTWHAANVAGNEYAGNDHVALAHDLRTIDAMGFRIVSLDRAIALLDGREAPPPQPCVALTFDDGTDFDVRPLDYPPHGVQPGFLPILRAFRDEAGSRQPELHATSFVIASPAARAAMDVQCLFGGNVMGEDWWKATADEGLLGIGNHSWDHNHAVAPDDAPDGMARGGFLAVDNTLRAWWQIDRAQTYIEARVAPHPVRHFGYPYGEANAFLRCEYLPKHGRSIGLVAAYTTEGRHATPDDNRWALPRYVCGLHWRSPEQLRALLAETPA
jgi:hypothetical protein